MGLESKHPIDRLLDSLEWKQLPPPVETIQGIPYATHEGILTIDNCSLKCYVLSDGKRVFDVDDVIRFFEG